MRHPHQIVIPRRAVLRSHAEVQNPGPLGSPDGNVAKFYLASADPGLGVGSIADVGHPGSKAVSGGGPHGSEIIHFIFWNDPLITQPRVVRPATITMRVNDYSISSADLAITLHTTDGQTITFPPSVVEPLLHLVATKVYDLRFADLPGVSTMAPLERFDARSGWWIAAENKLSGGHYWITSLTFTPEELTPAVEPTLQFD